MSAIDSIGRRVQAAYADASRQERLHVAGRLRSCPTAAVADATPRSGRILDFGCGHGVVALYLALTSSEREIVGVDVDGDKIVEAKRAAEAAGVAVQFEEVVPNYLPTGEWDAITIVDVLYLLGDAGAFDVLDAAAGALAAGGVLVVKEIDVRPRWKFWLAAAQEFVATRLLKITEGSRVHFLSPAEIERRLVANGMSVEHHPAHRGRLHPHHLVVGRVPS
ncbi:MAG TPA: class I SAM-dependent methyltransferase [Acidimicrobiales bacterium]|jgi:2-polyprenyl-3-methyl-5-hydroxy-6-metoxy-1,4-benzoquinol methylase|nr:class I SAM-dependent methyltransferase [Acidimicrobiales bacterium]